MARGHVGKTRLARLPPANRFRWTRPLVKLLGTMPDPALAKRLGLGRGAVQQERVRRGISAWRPFRRVAWTEDAVALLGTDTDAVVATALGVSQAAVWAKRRSLGIPSFFAMGRPSFRWTKWAISQLGTAPDREVARRLGLSQDSVRIKRAELEITAFRPDCGRGPIVWTRPMLAQLGNEPDGSVARHLGVSELTVLKKRRQLGIAPYREGGQPLARTPDLLAVLRLPDREIRARYATSVPAIRKLRREYGIARPRNEREIDWSDEMLERLGREPDAVVARVVGAAPQTIAKKRTALGIPPTRMSARWTANQRALLRGRLSDSEVARRLGRTVMAVETKRRELGIRPRKE